MYTKVLDIYHLLEYSRDHKPVVFVPGCFDLLHIGHTRLFEYAYRQGQYVVIGINSDESVSRIKPGRPILPEDIRAEMVGACAYVDAVYIFHEITPIKTIEELKPDIVIKGHDWLGHVLPEQATVDSYGGRVIIAPHFTDLTTSRIIDTCAQFKATEDKNER